MITDTSLSAEGRAPLKVPIFPIGSTEFGTAMAHYYRGEVGRMTSWRDRLDRTTNWAIAGSAAMLSVALSNTGAHHGVLLFAMGLSSCCWSSNRAGTASSTATAAVSVSSSATTSRRSSLRAPTWTRRSG